MSDSLWPCELQRARLPCPSPSPTVCSDSYPLSQWCHPTISFSVTCFSSFLRSFPALESFPMSRHQVAKVLELHHQSFQRIFRVDFLWGKVPGVKKRWKTVLCVFLPSCVILRLPVLKSVTCLLIFIAPRPMESKPIATEFDIMHFKKLQTDFHSYAA